eukprot:m.422334 g.422334  ORF g.422334 m.422334 type:complete len:561 (+) comp20199_c0_seq3:3-1685(+)
MAFDGGCGCSCSVTMSVLCALLLMLTCVAANDDMGSPPKPHIVYILTDNMGWAGVGYHRKPDFKEIQTPVLDHLAATGVRLDRLYAYKFCSPSRSALLSGRLPAHVNLLNSDQRIPGAGIPADMTTIATKLKQQGYATHHVGKWHVGMSSPRHTPKGRGFDSGLGYMWAYNGYQQSWAAGHCPQLPGQVSYIPRGDTQCTAASFEARNLSFTTDLWETNPNGTEGPALGLNGTAFEEAILSQRVLDIIDTHPEDTPLFVYYAMHMLHSPLCAPKAYLDKFAFITDSEDRRFVSAMTLYLDTVIGQIVDKLKSRGLWNNALLVWSSDNGAAIELTTGAKNAYPLKGGYYTNWEGGIRAPGLVNGGFLPHQVRGTILGGYIHLADWYATFCALSGAPVEDAMAQKAGLPPVDSLNMWPMLSGKNLTSPRQEFVLTPLTGGNSSHGNDAGYISGRYKIIVGNISQSSWEGPQYPNGSSHWDTWATIEQCTTKDKPACLFDILSDPTEHNDLALAMPEKVQELLTKLKAVNVFDPPRGKPDPAACEAVFNRYHGFWGPWLNVAD